MTVAAGIDIGNATTEVVLARLTGDGPEVLAVGRAPTRRAKGSVESLDGAAAVVRRLARQHGVAPAVAVAAPLRPVETATATVPEERADTGRLRLVSAGAGTTGGRGSGVGRPVLLGEPVEGDDPVVVVVPPGVGFAGTAAAANDLARRGRLAAVVMADDEAVLVANRLDAPVPVVDEVAVASVLAADRVAVEVSADGRPLRVLADPLRLVAELGLGHHEAADAARLGALLLDATSAVVAVAPDGGGQPAPVHADAWIEVAAGRVPFAEGHRLVRGGPVGVARAYAVPPADRPHAVDDLWTVDLAEVAAGVQARRAGTRARPVGLAALRSDAPYTDPAAQLADRLGVPVRTVPAEAAAARSGGLSTPGADEGTVVVDLGAGTIDTVAGVDAVVAAGGGELLTVSVAALTGVTAAAAEWVKRGPAHRVEAPQVLQAEDGSRGFLDRPAPPDTVGSLVVRGPAGLLPFHRTLAPGEWRALRLRLKTEVVGGNVARALRTLDAAPRSIVVVGGPAGDDEVLAAVAGALPAGTAVGRGNVAGGLGHRYAVAYGLLRQL